MNTMMWTQAKLLSAVVTVLAVIFCLYTGFVVGGMRSRHGVKAPAVTGAPEFERAYRVQMNTLEQFALFLPLLWIATALPVAIAYLAPALGLLWVVGRVLYMGGYMADPAKRSLGFGIGAVAVLGLLVLSIIGICRAWLALSP
jgi:glutathione S-transferase